MDNTSTAKGGDSDNGYRLVRLVNGERIIAKFSGRTSSKKVILERPMTVKGFSNSNPLIGITKEYLILTDWLEYCKDNEVRIPENQILTVSMPDEFLKEAYDAQKEYLDTGVAGPDLEDIPNLEDMTVKNLLEDLSGISSDLDDDQVEKFNQDSLQDFLGEFLSSIIGKASEKIEEDWSEDVIDKNREDFGNNLDDWSPYPDDYI